MSTDSGNLIENVYPVLTFRDEAAFRIPKSLREVAYIQSIDVFITSISWNLYENGKALPPIQFYGYAQLVTQDACTLEIPIHYPRQRIWFYRVEQALSQWRDIDAWYNGGLEWSEFFFNLLTQGQDPPVPLPPINYPDTNFVESPLREVYIKCPSGTQFDVEISQWEPVPFVGRNSVTFDGKSRQVDGEKDQGFPVTGLQPKKNPPNDPFAGNPSPSALSFESGYFVNKDLLSLSPPSGGNNGSTLLYWLRIDAPYRVPEWGCNDRFSTAYILLREPEEEYIYTFRSFGNTGCGNGYGLYRLTGLDGVILGERGFFSPFGATFTYGEGEVLPPESYYRIE